MQITCEKCQTSYQVDDKLIPPGGAAVQCTKCGNTFTAHPPQAVPQTRGPAKTVMMFAAEAPAAAVPATGSSPSNAGGLPARSTPSAAPPAGPVPTPMPSARPPSQGYAARPPSATVAAFPAAGAPISAPVVPVPAAPAPVAAPPAAARPSGVRPAGTISFASPEAAAVTASAATPIPVVTPRAGGSTPGAFSPTLPTPMATAAMEQSHPEPAWASAPQTSNPGGPIPTPLGIPEPDAKIAAAIPSSMLDQPINTSRPGRMTQMFFNQGEAVENANEQAAKAVAGEVNRKPGQTQMFMQAANLEEKLIRKSRAPLYLGLAVVVVLILAVVGAIYVPGLLGPPGADRQAVDDHEKAMALVHKDDVDSLGAADKQLAEILARKPRYAEAKADRAMVQQFMADDRLWQAERLKASYDALYKQVQQLTKANDPADASQRAKDVDALTSISKQYETLGHDAKAFEDQASKLVSEAAKDDPKNPFVIRARGFISADHDMTDTAQKLAKNYLHEINKPRDAWAELILAEADTAGKASEDKRQDGLTHVQAVVALDPSLVRARYLRVRLDTMNKKEAEAKDDVSALGAANQGHLGGASLLAGLEEELAREKADKEVRDAKIAAANAGQPPTSVKKGTTKVTAKGKKPR